MFESFNRVRRPLYLKSLKTKTVPMRLKTILVLFWKSMKWFFYWGGIGSKGVTEDSLCLLNKDRHGHLSEVERLEEGLKKKSKLEIDPSASGDCKETEVKAYTKQIRPKMDDIFQAWINCLETELYDTEFEGCPANEGFYESKKPGKTNEILDIELSYFNFDEKELLDLELNLGNELMDAGNDRCSEDCGNDSSMSDDSFGREKICGICFESISKNKNFEGRRFGILDSCDHVFCYACARNLCPDPLKLPLGPAVCPECGVASNNVVASSKWISSTGEKHEFLKTFDDNFHSAKWSDIVGETDVCVNIVINITCGIQ